MSGWGFDFTSLQQQLGEINLSNLGEKLQSAVAAVKEDVEHGLEAQLRAERLGLRPEEAAAARAPPQPAEGGRPGGC